MTTSERVGGRVTVARGYRVLSVLRTGGSALVCLAVSRGRPSRRFVGRRVICRTGRPD
jgi:hypothetical protein